MQETKGYGEVKEFLSFNNKNFSAGHVYGESFDIEYYVGDELRYQGEEIVHFTVQHPEFRSDIEIMHLDTDIYYIGFSPKFQEYIFDETENTLTVNNKSSSNKFGKPFKVLIHGRLDNKTE